MNRFVKNICILLVCVLLVQAAGFRVSAAEVSTPTASLLPDEPYNEEISAVETTPAATVPAETVPTETEPVETEPAETEPEETEPPILECEVPRFLQTDYPEDLYGYGTIATDGCSVTCLAMIATYMTGHTYTPDYLASFVGLYNGTYVDRLEFGLKTLRIPYQKAGNWHHVLNALKEGKQAIIMVNYKSAFTDTQHFLVLGGMTEDGRIIVNDPYGPNYDVWHLKNGFANGFDAGDVCCGYSNGWIFDIGDMPEEPFIYNHVEAPYGEPRYPDLELTPEEKTLLAKVIWTEARGETIRGQQAVAEVILNRMMSDKYPSSLKGIVYADDQFTGVKFMEEATPSQIQYVAIERALRGPYVLPETVLYYAVFKVNTHVWGKIGGHYFCYDYDLE